VVSDAQLSLAQTLHPNIGLVRTYTWSNFSHTVVRAASNVCDVMQ